MSQFNKYWQVSSIDGHEVRWFEPERIHPDRYVVLFCHDSEGDPRIDHDQWFHRFAELGLRVAVPITGPTWWLDHVVTSFDRRYSPHDFLRYHLRDTIHSRWGVDPPGIGLFGVGMGGQGALHLSYRAPREFPVVAALRPKLDFHLLVPEGDVTLTELFGDRERARQDTAILHIHPLNWPPHQFFCCDPTDYAWIDGADRLRMKLQAVGVPFTCDLETSVPVPAADGTRRNYVNALFPQALGFLLNGLERERLRVP